MKAIIPAAGLGTRFLPATKAIPKEMLPVLNKPVIQYIVEEAASAKDDACKPLVNEVVIVSNSHKQTIEDHFSSLSWLDEELSSKGKNDLLARVENLSAGARVSFVYQEEPRGLGHAVWCGMQNLGHESCFVLLGDTIIDGSDILEDMQSISKMYGDATVLAVFPVARDQVDRFGIISGEEVSKGVWRVSSLVEKPSVEEAPTNLAIFGRYLLSPAVKDILEKTEPGVGGEIQLTDALDALLASEEIYALVIDPAQAFDTGTVESWLDTNNRFRAKQK